jgi:GxxExxY protein
MEFDDLSNRVIGCAIEVHRELGPGLLESAYEQCLAHELQRNGITFQL